MRTQNLLEIRDHRKTIPYVSGIRPEGSSCHGFLPLKGAAAERIRSVPEACDLPSLAEALVSINDPRTAFFSIGCEKSLNVTPGGVSMRGCLEFAFNSVDYVSDAHWYFKLFFAFHRLLVERSFDHPFQFLWQVERAEFTNVQVTGFTAAVWLTTAELPTRRGATELWGSGLALLTEHLCDYPVLRGEPIQRPNDDAVSSVLCDV